MVSDVRHSLSKELGIINEAAGVPNRATFIVDPMGMIRYVNVTELNVGRGTEEVLRVIDALQSDELCPCNWKKGEETLKPKV
jgi:alkyl hydroperoxide reductase subunit AhpC